MYFPFYGGWLGPRSLAGSASRVTARPAEKIRRKRANAAVFLTPREICEGEDLSHLPGFKT